MPVGSEWWGAQSGHPITEGIRGASPMPVGSEWWGAAELVGSNRIYGSVANACRQ